MVSVGSHNNLDVSNDLLWHQKLAVYDIFLRHVADLICQGMSEININIPLLLFVPGCHPVLVQNFLLNVGWRKLGVDLLDLLTGGGTGFTVCWLPGYRILFWLSTDTGHRS